MRGKVKGGECIGELESRDLIGARVFGVGHVGWGGHPVLEGW